MNSICINMFTLKNFCDFVNMISIFVKLPFTLLMYKTDVQTE